MADVSRTPGRPGGVAGRALSWEVVGRSFALMAGNAVGQPVMVDVSRQPGRPGGMAGRTLALEMVGWPVFRVAGLAVRQAGMVDASRQPGRPGRVTLGTLAVEVVGWTLAEVAGLAVGQGGMVYAGRFPPLSPLHVAGRALQVAKTTVAGRLDLFMAGFTICWAANAVWSNVATGVQAS